MTSFWVLHNSRDNRNAATVPPAVAAVAGEERLRLRLAGGTELPLDASVTQVPPSDSAGRRRVLVSLTNRTRKERDPAAAAAQPSSPGGELRAPEAQQRRLTGKERTALTGSSESVRACLTVMSHLSSRSHGPHVHTSVMHGL